MLTHAKIISHFTSRELTLKMFQHALLLIFFFLPQDFAVQDLPAFIQICHQSDPNLNACVKKSVENIRPLLKNGIPEFDIPSCEPLVIPEVTIDQGSGPVSVKSVYKDIKVYGPSEFDLKFVKIDFDRNKVKFKLFLPKLELTSTYSMDGRILMMPISGEGLCRGNYSDIDVTVLIQGQRIKKGKEIYFNVKDFFVNFNIGHATIFLDNLFNGDKELGEGMNLFLNENWKSVTNEIRPVLEDTIAGIFKKLSNKIYHKYPLDVLFPK